jgi:valyl-tRNA synthetase
MLSRLNACTVTVNRALAQYRYHEAAQALWQFFWHEFCDWYIEIKKLRFREGSGLTNDWRNVLFVFETSLRLLHPLMPFITEELWQRLGGQAPAPVSVALAPYPEPEASLEDRAAEREMETVQNIITAARNLRAEMKADPRQTLDAALFSGGPALDTAAAQLEVIEKLAGVKLELKSGAAPKASGILYSAPEFDLVLRVPAAQAGAQRQKLEKQIEQLEKVIENSRRQLADEKFLERAPAAVVQSLKEKLADYEVQLEKSRAALEAIPQP